MMKHAGGGEKKDKEWNKMDVSIEKQRIADEKRTENKRKIDDVTVKTEALLAISERCSENKKNEDDGASTCGNGCDSGSGSGDEFSYAKSQRRSQMPLG